MPKNNILQQIQKYLESLSEPKSSDISFLFEQIGSLSPTSKIWYLDGKDETGKVVTNPNIGFGSYMIQYANGTSKEFYRVGLSANSTGISVYIMGLDDKNYLKNKLSITLGKAKITSYCISFKSLKDIDVNLLMQVVQERLK